MRLLLKSREVALVTSVESRWYLHCCVSGFDRWTLGLSFLGHLDNWLFNLILGIVNSLVDLLLLLQKLLQPLLLLLDQTRLFVHPVLEGIAHSLVHQHLHAGLDLLLKRIVSGSAPRLLWGRLAGDNVDDFVGVVGYHYWANLVVPWMRLDLLEHGFVPCQHSMHIVIIHTIWEGYHILRGVLRDHKLLVWVVVGGGVSVVVRVGGSSNWCDLVDHLWLRTQILASFEEPFILEEFVTKIWLIGRDTSSGWRLILRDIKHISVPIHQRILNHLVRPAVH